MTNLQFNNKVVINKRLQGDCIANLAKNFLQTISPSSNWFISFKQKNCRSLRPSWVVSADAALNSEI